ncbi:hypothetical protein [Halomonas sp. E19]|uniref:hypothetical protein n=1 Tax=Halomonas sp. E19 TaxID=3397247 RepID=UPI0040349F91
MLERKAPAFALLLFMTFALGNALWPLHSAIRVAEGQGQEPRQAQYQQARLAYTAGVAELVVNHSYLFDLSQGILENKKLYCLMGEFLQQSSDAMPVSAEMLSRYANLCNVFSTAVDMLDTYADRMAQHEGLPPTLYRFTFKERGEVKEVGPFFTLQECGEITSRMAFLEVQVSACVPYEDWHYPYIFSQHS